MEELSEIKPTYIGFIACLISVILFGSNLAIVKKYDTGDGFFFNWVYCSAIWVMGLALNLWQSSPVFYPLAMVGGVLWATGGLCVSLILQYIGLGLGLCIWATFNMIVGWACGRFGLFGIQAHIPEHPIMNYTACFLSLISAVLYLSVKATVTNSYLINNSSNNSINNNHDIGGTYDIQNEHSTHSANINYDIQSQQPLLIDSNMAINSLSNNSTLLINNNNNNDTIDSSVFAASLPSESIDPSLLRDDYTFPAPKIPNIRQPSGTLDSNSATLNGTTNAMFSSKRIVGSLLAIVAGCLYGVNFVPVIYIQDNYPEASKRGLPYIFAHFSGIYLAATMYFVAYTLYFRVKAISCFNLPFINSRQSGYILPNTLPRQNTNRRTQPWISARLILPTFISGLLWSVATCAWFVANEILSQTVSFPIIASLPPIIAGLWALFVFGEITGRKNIILLFVAFGFSICGAILAGLSF